MSVAGRLRGEIEKPLPLTITEFTVTAAVPDEVRVTVCVVALLTTMAPKEMLLAFRLRTGFAAFSCRESVREVLPVVAVRVTACEVLTDAICAMKVALVAPAGTVTELGTVTALLLLARPTFKPAAGANPERLTVHASASDPVMEMLLQKTALTVDEAAMPVPARFTVAEGALLAIVTKPV